MTQFNEWENPPAPVPPLGHSMYPQQIGKPSLLRGVNL